MKPVKSLLIVRQVRGEIVRGGIGARTGQAGLQQVLVAGAVVAQQPDRRGLAFDDGIVQQVGALQLATAQVDVHVEHVGADVEHRIAGGFGCRHRRGCRCADHRHIAACANRRHRRGAGCRSGCCGRRRLPWHRRLRHIGRQRVGALLGFGRLHGSGGSGRIARREVGNPGLVVQQQGQREADPENGSQVFHGTGSIPPSLKGWQRRILLVVSDSPFIGPCLSIASRA